MVGRVCWGGWGYQLNVLVGVAVGRVASLVPSPRCWLQVACSSRSARFPVAPYCPSAWLWSACNGLLSQFADGSRYMGLPHHQHGVPSLWLWMSRLRVLSCAQPRPCWVLVSFLYCMGHLPILLVLWFRFALLLLLLCACCCECAQA